MTNLDEQIDNILLEHIVLATDNGQPYIKSTDTAVEAIKALIATQIQEARVDELRRIPRTNYGNDFTIHIKAYLDSRIKQLGYKIL
jgi:hypothetical protein